MIERRADYPIIQERLARIEERQIAIDKRINGSIDDIHDHIKAGDRWRAIIIGIAVSVVIQIVAFSYIYGNLSKTVCVNERILQRILAYSKSNAAYNEEVK